mmetsp:Transcript_5051/g.8670  ORF Transcript_5051/g.8670 Transcript_5051/m.8670 type:complete len:593 (-) Transcript_5051:755-2533(-)
MRRSTAASTDYPNDDSDGEEALPAPKTKIRLFLRANNIRSSTITSSLTGQQPHTQCRVSLDPDSHASSDSTETVYKSSSPNYTTSFPLEYEEGSQLMIYVDVYACKGSGIMSDSSPELKWIGRVNYNVQDILDGNPSQTKARSLPKGGTIYAQIEREFSGDNNLTLRLRAHSLVFTNSRLRNSLVATTTLGKPSTYFELSRPAKSSSSSWIVVYRSNSIRESTTPMWDKATIDLNSICSDEILRISVKKEEKKKCKEIGSFETTIQCMTESCQIDEHMRSSFVLQPTSTRGPRGRQSNKKTGQITVVSAYMQRRDEVLNEIRQKSQKLILDHYLSSGENNPLQEISTSNSKFSDYVDAGLDIGLCVAIDFTSSNGDPQKPGTLHFIRDGMSNDYIDAIESIGSAVEKYSKSKESPVWGFGAKFPSDVSPELAVEELPVRHIFQCGEVESATGTPGIVDAYRYVFELGFHMSGPTVMLPVINAAAFRADKIHKDPSKQLKYTVLLILTDGVVNDLDSTKKFISNCRHLPLSFVVVGIGRADFTEMNEWNEQQPDLRGRFTFVEFRDLQFDPAALSKKALERLPEDVVDYFTCK